MKNEKFLLQMRDLFYIRKLGYDRIRIPSLFTTNGDFSETIIRKISLNGSIIFVNSPDDDTGEIPFVFISKIIKRKIFDIEEIYSIITVYKSTNLEDMSYDKIPHIPTKTIEEQLEDMCIDTEKDEDDEKENEIDYSQDYEEMYSYCDIDELNDERNNLKKKLDLINAVKNKK